MRSPVRWKVRYKGVLLKVETRNGLVVGACEVVALKVAKV
jgi:hypothetical protein